MSLIQIQKQHIKDVTGTATTANYRYPPHLVLPEKMKVQCKHPSTTCLSYTETT